MKCQVEDCFTSHLAEETWIYTYNLESEDFAIDTDLPNFRIQILIIADELNELDVGSGSASKWLQLWARNPGERRSLDPHLVWVGRIV